MLMTYRGTQESSSTLAECDYWQDQAEKRITRQNIQTSFHTRIKYSLATAFFLVIVNFSCNFPDWHKLISMCMTHSFAESTLRQFCKFVKIPFQEPMLHWHPPPKDQANLFQLLAFKTAGETTSFGTPSPAANLEDLLDDIQVAGRNAIPIYSCLKEAKADESFKLDTHMSNGFCFLCKRPSFLFELNFIRFEQICDYMIFFIMFVFCVKKSWEARF